MGRLSRTFTGVIHPTAIIHPKAKLDSTVDVGPYAVIDADVELGPECRVGPHVYLTGVLKAGARNVFHASAVIGDAPQDLKYHGEPTGLVIGDGNTFRECVTVHRSARMGELTVVGSNCFFMATSHVGHNCRVGNGVILANGLSLGGQATVDDRAFLSGNCLVHQFVRVGTLAMMQGGSAISKDLPPFCVAHEVNVLCGLNIVGMRRAGFSAAERMEVKRLYKFLFREGRRLRPALAEAESQFKSAPSRAMLEFLAGTKRGCCASAGTRHVGDEEE